MNKCNIPANWCEVSHRLWLDNKHKEAIAHLHKQLKQDVKNKGFFIQLGYYMYIKNNFKDGVACYEKAHELFSDDIKIMELLSVMYMKNKQYDKAILFAKKVTKTDKDNFNMFDVLAKAYSRMQDYDMAIKAGKKSLFLKDKRYTKQIDKDYADILNYSATKLAKGKKKVISYTLFGKENKYLYGALRNAMLYKDIYRDWEIWFYVDNSVPKSFIDTLKEFGAIIKMQPDNQTLREKLCWRFKVANEKDVGYFLIRDVDSTLSAREYDIVQRWIKSDKLFHIIRDWWSHTELILAGLWGGVAGVLPDMDKLLHDFKSTSMETSNIDQIFLRESIWSYVKQSCFIYDRFFLDTKHHISNDIKFDSKFHIGICEYNYDREYQKKIIYPIARYKNLNYLFEQERKIVKTFTISIKK